jgi:hypothetical protein
MPEQSKRLIRVAILLADLIRQLTSDRTISYQRLADLAGVPRNVLYYFVGNTKVAPTKETSVKVEVLAKLLQWFETTDFKVGMFTPSQIVLVEQLREVLEGELKPTALSKLIEGFAQTSEDLSGLTQKLSGRYFGIRERGTTQKLQVSLLNFWVENSEKYFNWEMYFRQGVEDGINLQSTTGLQQEIQKVEGICTREGSSVTCIGKRIGTHELHYLVIILTNQTALTPSVFNATYTTYSRKEAISRPMALCRLDGISDQSFIRGLNLIADYKISDIPKEIQLSKTRIQKLRLGFSVSEDDVKPNISLSFSIGVD